MVACTVEASRTRRPVIWMVASLSEEGWHAFLGREGVFNATVYKVSPKSLRFLQKTCL